MRYRNLRRLTLWLAVTTLIAAILACNVSTAVTPATQGSEQNTLPANESPQANLPTATSGQTNLPTETPPQMVSTEVPTTAPIIHTLVPGELPASSLSEITDRDSSAFAPQKRAGGGDSFSTNLYERPFNANTMDTYFPDLDITGAKLLRDAQWVYVTVYLVGQNSAGGLPGDYGVELDLNVDGRGDMLLMATKPDANWSTGGVQVWVDNNHDVGGAHPILSDAPASSDGYETLVFDQGVGNDPDAAWARVSPSDPKSVQIAFKRTLINDSGHFTWGVWAMNASMFNPAWFDYNDHFTAAEAGSPLIEMTQYYPIKALAELDNTCRWAVGFTPTGSEPGICPVPAPPVPNVPGPNSGTISGEVYYNGINGGTVLGPTSAPLSGQNVRARSGDCGSAGAVVATASTNGAGMYTLSVSPGTYCVDVNPPPYGSGTSPQTVTVAAGASVNGINFGYYTKLT